MPARNAPSIRHSQGGHLEKDSAKTPLARAAARPSKNADADDVPFAFVVTITLRDLEERCGINATPSNKPHVPDELCRERLWTCFIRGRHARPSVPNDVDERVLIEQRCVWRPGSG